MTITKRTLERWRKEALFLEEGLRGWDSAAENTRLVRGLCRQVIRMTAELLDQHLMKERKS